MRRKCTTNWGRREQEIEIKRCFLASILGCVIYLKMLTLCPLCFFPLCSPWCFFPPQRTQWEETQRTQSITFEFWSLKINNHFEFAYSTTSNKKSFC